MVLGGLMMSPLRASAQNQPVEHTADSIRRRFPENLLGQAGELSGSQLSSYRRRLASDILDEKSYSFNGCREVHHR